MAYKVNDQSVTFFNTPVGDITIGSPEMPFKLNYLIDDGGRIVALLNVARMKPVEEILTMIGDGLPPEAFHDPSEQAIIPNFMDMLQQRMDSILSDEPGLNILTPSPGETVLFRMLSRFNLLWTGFHEFLLPEEVIDKVLLPAMEQDVHEYTATTGVVSERALIRKYQLLFSQIQMPVTRPLDGYMNEDRIIFLYPELGANNLEAYRIHPSFRYCVDFLVSQSEARTKAALCNGAYIQDGKVYPGTYPLCTINLHRPLLPYINPIRLSVSHSGAIRERTRLCTPSESPVLDSHGFDLTDCRKARVALMEYKGFTHEEGVVVSESFSEKMKHKRRERKRIYWITDTKGLNQLTPSRAMEKVLNGTPVLLPNNSTLYTATFSNQEPQAYRAHSRWQAKEVLVYSAVVTTSKKSLSEDPEQYYQAILSLFEWASDETTKTYISSLISLLEATPVHEHARQVERFVQKHYVPAIAMLIGECKITCIDIDMEWIVDLTRGSKITTLQAWKGIVTRILPDDEMPLLPTEEGELPAEIIISPSKIRKRDIPALILELGFGRIGGYIINGLREALDPFEDPRKHLVKEFYRQQIHPDGDFLKLPVTESHLNAIRQTVDWRLEQNETWVQEATELLNSETSLTDATKLKWKENITSEADRLRTWLINHHPQKLFRNKSFGSSVIIDLPFRTYWGLCAWTRCPNDPRVICGAEITESDYGLSLSSGNAKLSSNEAAIVRRDLPHVAAWINNLGRALPAFKKLRSALVRGDMTPSLDQQLKDLTALGVRIPPNVLDLWKETDETSLEILASGIKRATSRKNDLMRTLLEPGHWTYTLQTYGFGEMNMETGTFEQSGAINREHRVFIDNLTHAMNNTGHMPEGWTQFSTTMFFYKTDIGSYPGYEQGIRVVLQKIPAEDALLTTP